MNKYVKFFDNGDLASGYELRKAESVIDSFDIHAEQENINKIIELYNIKLYFDNDIYLYAWNESTKSKYIEVVKQFNGVIGKFFSTIDGSNITHFWKNTDVRYRENFWELIDYYNIYKKINSAQFVSLIKTENVLSHILCCKKLVNYFGTQIACELTTNLKYAKTIFSFYMLKQKQKKIYIPSELTQEDKKNILLNYIAWEKADPNYLLIISNCKQMDDLAINDRIRYAAYKKYQECIIKVNETNSVYRQEFGASVTFSDKKDETQLRTEDSKNTVMLSYNSSWIKENLDYPTLLNNFIYLFNFVDLQFRYQHLANPNNMGIFERDFFMAGQKDYKIGIDYHIRRITSITQMSGYMQQLQLNNIKLEELFKWFFETYLYEEFNAKGFCYFIPSDQASWLEKILLLITQFDSIIKQFRHYIEDHVVDRDFLEFSSDQYKLSDTPSMVSEKYIYPASKRIESAMWLFYSDQSMIYYIDDEDKYNDLFHLLAERQMRIADFAEYNQSDINWLITEGFVYLDVENYVKVKTEIACILKDLFQNGVISYPFYKKNLSLAAEQISEWLKTGDVISKQSLFTTQEQEFIDYMLNVQKYENGPELRNKYAHGIFPKDVKIQEQHYIELLRIMILIIIKINEEFCILFPEQ